MTNSAIIGLHHDELSWLRLVVSLLRHPDPTVGELTRQAILYLQTSASDGAPIDNIAASDAVAARAHSC